ncbi:PaaI family thioesterase [Peribacillus simplex]|uniref:PaaI family thioesterase n=1 Tax=Peribacillus simplex TaxID=1478 RepID=UPI00366C757A
MVKKKNDEDKIHEKHYEQIHEQVKNDPYALSLGIQLTKFEAGAAEATLEVQSTMVNAYGTVHGAVIHALGDHAFSVACNAYGKTSLGLSTTLQFIESAKPGDKIAARATGLNLMNKIKQFNSYCSELSSRKLFLMEPKGAVCSLFMLFSEGILDNIYFERW